MGDSPVRSSGDCAIMGKFSLSVIMFSSALLGTVALSASSQAADLAEAAQAAAKAAAEKAAMGMLPLKPFAGAKGFYAYAPDADVNSFGSGNSRFIEFNPGWNAAVFGGAALGDFVKLQLDTGYISNNVSGLRNIDGGSGTVGAAYVLGGVTVSAPLAPLTEKVRLFGGISLGVAFPNIGTIDGTLNGQPLTIRGDQSSVGALLARGGVTVALTPKLGGTLEYGFFQTANFTVSTTDNLSQTGRASTDYTAHLIGIGFEYNF